MTHSRARPTLVIGLLLFGAAVALYWAEPYGLGAGQGRRTLLLLLAACAQGAVAAALFLGLRGASIAAMLVLAAQLGIVMLVLVFLGPVALLISVPNPETGSTFSLHPLTWAALAGLAFGATLVYAAAARSLWPSGWLGGRPSPTDESAPEAA